MQPCNRDLIQCHLIEFAFRQGLLALLQHQSQTQKVQTCIVPWLLSRYGVNYKRDGGHAVVIEMLIALVKCDNLAGLADHIDLLKDRHAMAMREIAKRAWFTALKGINKHRDKIRVNVMEVLADARAATDVVANHVAEKVLGTKSLAPSWT